jgi:hypothetical protein
MVKSGSKQKEYLVDYPAVCGYLNAEPKVFNRRTYPSQRDSFLETVQAITEYHAAGTIPNVRFDEHKAALGSIIYDVFSKLRETRGDWRSQSDVMKKFEDTVLGGNTTILAINGKHKKAITYDQTDPYVIRVMAVINELVVVADMMESLKAGKPTKREVKPVEERVVGYKPPPVTTETQRQVVAMLEAVTETEYQKLRQLIIDDFTRLQRLFLKAVLDDLIARKKVRSPTAFFHPDYRQVAPIIEKTVEKAPPKDGLDIYIVLPGVTEKVFNEKATEIADDYRRFFVHKNYLKIASVIEAKGGYKTAETLDHSVSLTGMEGTFQFTFKDKSNFVVVNQCVPCISPNGKPFYRFPLTFRRVMLPNGTMMTQPSEERMNQIFVKA